MSLLPRIGAELDRRLPVLFVIAGAALGSAYALILPPLQAPDEVGHFHRAFMISQGHWIAEMFAPVPAQVPRLRTIYPEQLEKTTRITTGEYGALASIALQESPESPIGFTGACLYPPAPYVAPAAVLNIARRFHAPVIDLMYLGRFANLGVYLVLVYFALRMMPGQRVLLFLLALMPMALHQAASLSADSFTIAISFLLCAYIFKLAFGDERPITTRQCCVVTAMILAIALSKFVVWFAALLLLLPASKFRNGRQRWLFVGLELALAVMVAGGWQLLNHENLMHNESWLTSRDIHDGMNVQFAIHHPLLVLQSFWPTLINDSMPRQFIGTFGWLAVNLPVWYVLGYAVLLGVAALTTGFHLRMTRVQRLVIGAVAVLGTAAILIGVFTYCAPRSYLDDSINKGISALPGVQGRYLIPIALLWFMLLTNGRIRLNAGVMTAVAIFLVTVSSITGLNAIGRTYYAAPSSEPGSVELVKAMMLRGVPHGRYEGNLIRREGDVAVFLVRDGHKQAVDAAGANQIVTVPAEDFDAIPSGQ